jgi:hypothetical protein
MFSEANGSRSTLALEKKASEEMEMTEKGIKQKVFFLLKRIINLFFWVGGDGGFVIYIDVNPHWESGPAIYYMEEHPPRIRTRDRQAR